MSENVKKSFWKRPEGKTGMFFIAAIAIGVGIVGSLFLGAISAFLSTTIGLIVSLLVLGVIIFTALDPKARNLIWYMYKSIMRWITGMFIQIDPIGILKNYVDDLKDNLKKMNRQISQLRGQMHKLKEMIINNKKEITTNIELASKARENNDNAVMVLKSRKAGRLKESTMKLEDLYKKMEVLYRVLGKMFENSQIMMEDINDQVEVKEQERKAILASNSAMKSAMNIISGNKDKKEMFDRALEAVADDVSQKVGEMEQFMEVSQNFMQSLDLQNGIFEEEGLKMLEKWENEGMSILLGDEKEKLLTQANNDADVLDLDAPISQPEMVENRRNQYDNFFE
jgi:chromosome segregation ATPase